MPALLISQHVSVAECSQDLTSVREYLPLPVSSIYTEACRWGKMHWSSTVCVSMQVCASSLWVNSQLVYSELRRWQTTNWVSWTVRSSEAFRWQRLSGNTHSSCHYNAGKSSFSSWHEFKYSRFTLTLLNASLSQHMLVCRHDLFKPKNRTQFNLNFCSPLLQHLPMLWLLFIMDKVIVVLTFSKLVYTSALVGVFFCGLETKNMTGADGLFAKCCNIRCNSNKSDTIWIIQQPCKLIQHKPQHSLQWSLTFWVLMGTFVCFAALLAGHLCECAVKSIKVVYFFVWLDIGGVGASVRSCLDHLTSRQHSPFTTCAERSHASQVSTVKVMLRQLPRQWSLTQLWAHMCWVW